MPRSSGLVAMLAVATLVAPIAVGHATTVSSVDKEIDVRIVYWGPVATSEIVSYAFAKTTHKSALTSIGDDHDPGVFFDFVPDELGEIRGHTIRFHLISTPQAKARAGIRKLVLDGVDGIVFVADADPASARANADSLAELKDRLREARYDFDRVYLVVQIVGGEKRGAVPSATLLKSLGLADRPFQDAYVKTGVGVFDALKTVAKMILIEVKTDHPADNKVRATTPVR